MSATLLASRLSARPASMSARARLAGRVLTGFIALFLAWDAAIKLAGVRQAVEGTVQLGWPAHLVPVIGMIEVVLLALYLLPRTAPLGAVLWTGYLGGAIATQLRLENPLFSHVLFPIYVAAFVWGGLWLRDARVRALFAPTR